MRTIYKDIEQRFSAAVFELTELTRSMFTADDVTRLGGESY